MFTSMPSAVLATNVPSPLDSVAFHQDVDCIRRFFAPHFPVHLAVHRIDHAEEADREYTALHTHDVPEINIVIPDPSGLVYRLHVGGTIHEVDGHTSVWIPAGVPHSANVVRGSGYFVAVRLDSERR